MNKTCLIHQPDFFPWLGFFDKIQQCDKFVLLDDAQITKTGSSYLNRVSFNIAGVSKEFTAPIVRTSGTQNYNETQYINNKWKSKLKKTIQANYAKAKNFNQYKNDIFELIEFDSYNLVEYNLNAIKKICKILNIDLSSKLVLSSDLNINTTSTQRLIDICQKTNTNTYLSGHGAKDYQVEYLFKENDINLIYHDFNHPIYTQKSETFIYGLSAIDYIFEGLDK